MHFPPTYNENEEKKRLHYICYTFFLGEINNNKTVFTKKQEITI